MVIVTIMIIIMMVIIIAIKGLALRGWELRARDSGFGEHGIQLLALLIDKQAVLVDL